MGTRTTNVRSWAGSTGQGDGVPCGCLSCDLCRDDDDGPTVVVAPLPRAGDLPALRLRGPVPVVAMPGAEDSLELIFGHELNCY